MRINTPEVAETLNGKEIRCGNCGAGYGFSACRNEACPVRAPKSQTRLSSVYTSGPSFIVLGNEKGGSGKSTIAMHLIVALMRRGFRVGAIDLDGRQGTLSRYIENRRTFASSRNVCMECPQHRRIGASEADIRQEAEREDTGRLREAVLELSDQDFLVIDTPGADSVLSHAGHALANVLITPVNDSFFDFDLLALIDEDGKHIKALGKYANFVGKLRAGQVFSGQRPMKWVVIRNRLSHINSRNKREMLSLFQEASKRANFHLASGIGERVIFRELFLKGLTLFDLPDQAPGMTLSMSHLAARQEMHMLFGTIGLDKEKELSPNREPAV